MPRVYVRCSACSSVAVSCRGFDRNGLNTAGRRAPFKRAEPGFRFRLFSFLDLNIICLVYPKPVPGNRIGVAAALNDGTTGIKPGTSDFYNLREYQKGDSLKQLAWKKYAAGQGVFTKQFVDGSDEHVCLDWNLFTGFGIEDRLSMLCYLVGQYSLKNVKYALHLPNYQSPVGSGAGHRRLLLEKLALYGVACD